MSTTEVKNILIVGLGVGGIAVVSGLAAKLPLTHRLVVVTEHEFGYWPIGSLRAAVVPGKKTIKLLFLSSINIS